VTYRCDTMHQSNMRSTLLPFCLVAFCFSLLAFVPPADAQCSANMISFGDIGVVADNPFQAEVVTTRSPIEPESLITHYPQLIARDSQGRVRTERVAGEFKRNTGPDAGTKAEMRLIIICDPVAQTTTMLNTSNLTAQIRRSPPSEPTSSRGQVTPHPFCSGRLLLNQLDRIHGVDLGVQTIQGVEAHGARAQFIKGVTTIVNGSKTSDPPNDNVRDTWCSDDLSAIVLTVAEDPKTGEKYTQAMQNIVRTEPDPLLFQVPPGYTVTESVAEPREHPARPPSAPQPAAATPAQNP